MTDPETTSAVSAGEEPAPATAAPPQETPTAPAPPHVPGPVGGPAAPLWLRAASEWTWRSLVIGFGIVAAVYALGYLRIVVLPIIIALLVTTLLLPPKRWLVSRKVPNGLATSLTMVGAVLVFAGLMTAIAPSIANQSDELRTGVEDGIREASDVLAEEPFNLSREELRDRVDEGIARLRENSESLTEGVTEGAVIVGELLTGLIVVILLTFFFLNDGRGMWNWIVGLVAPHNRRGADEIGARVFAALAGYVRGIALVGAADAILIGIALLILGVPLVVPLMILIFIGAFLPLIGAFLAGLTAVLIALVSNGLVTALLVLAAIVIVQQVEGHVLYPLLMSRTVHLHPAVIVVALAIGGIVAGIIGIFLAVPVAGVISTIIGYVRDRPQPEPPLAPAEAEAVPS